jgi:hypothetical protein
MSFKFVFASSRGFFLANSAAQGFSFQSPVIELESPLSDEAVYSQNQVKKIAYLENTIKTAQKIRNAGKNLSIVGALLTGILLSSYSEAIAEVGVSGLQPHPLLAFLTSLSPFLFILGLCIWKYHPKRLKQLEKEYYELYALRGFAEKNLKTES